MPTRHNQWNARKVIYGRNLPTRIDAMKPDIRRDMAAKQMSQAIRPTGQHRELTLGQSVAVRNYWVNENWVYMCVYIFLFICVYIYIYIYIYV